MKRYSKKYNIKKLTTGRNSERKFWLGANKNRQKRKRRNYAKR